MKIRTLIFLQIIPLIVVILIGFVFSISLWVATDRTNSGLGGLAILYSPLVFAFIANMAFLFYTFYSWLLIGVEILLLKKFHSGGLKTTNTLGFIFIGFIEGYWLGLGGLVVAAINVYIFVLYVIYKYKNSQYSLAIKNNYIIRIILIVVVALSFGAYYDNYNNSNTPIPIESLFPKKIVK